MPKVIGLFLDNKSDKAMLQQATITISVNNIKCLWWRWAGNGGSVKEKDTNKITQMVTTRSKSHKSF